LLEFNHPAQGKPDDPPDTQKAERNQENQRYEQRQARLQCGFAPVGQGFGYLKEDRIADRRGAVYPVCLRV
jgi:hypothetical protein